MAAPGSHRAEPGGSSGGTHQPLHSEREESTEGKDHPDHGAGDQA